MPGLTDFRESRFDFQGTPPRWYGVDEGYLERIRQASGNWWKDLFFFSLPLAIVLLRDALTENTDRQCHISLDFTLNSGPDNLLGGVASAVVALVSVTVWAFTGKRLSKIFQEIRKQPRVTLVRRDDSP